MKNLILIGKKYYVRKAVPVDLQSRIGKKLITRKTETSDIKEAEKRAHKILAEIDNIFDRTRGNVKGWECPEIIIKEAREAVALDQGVEWQRTMRELVDKGNLTPAHEEALKIGQWQLAAWEWLDHNNSTPEQTEALKIGFDIATGKQVMSLSEGLELYLKHVEGKVIKQTYNNKKQRVQKLIDTIGDKQLKDITRLQAQTYVTDNITNVYANVNTRKNNLRDIVAFFSWCVDSDLIDKSVFANIKMESHGTAQKLKDERRHWEDSEIKNLVTTLATKKKKSDPLIPMVQIAMYTGLRINELCEMEIVDVHDDYLEVVKSKNKNSLRKIPIHKNIKKLVTQLVECSSDGFLISGLKTGGADDKRSHSVSKKFGNFIRAHVTKDKGLTFHSLRNTFSNKLEVSRVPVGTAEMLLGHARQSMTYGRYSKSLPLETLAEAVSKVEYKL